MHRSRDTVSSRVPQTVNNTTMIKKLSNMKAGMMHGGAKNDEKSSSKDKDVIDTIVDKTHSTDTSFKIEAHALLSP